MSKYEIGGMHLENVPLNTLKKGDYLLVESQWLKVVYFNSISGFGKAEYKTGWVGSTAVIDVMRNGAIFVNDDKLATKYTEFEYQMMRLQ
jgi:hypothetical protein